MIAAGILFDIIMLIVLSCIAILEEEIKMSEHTVTHPNMVRNARENKRAVYVFSTDSEALERVRLMYEDFAVSFDSFIEKDKLYYRVLFKMPPYMRNQMVTALNLSALKQDYHSRMRYRTYLLSLEED